MIDGEVGVDVSWVPSMLRHRAVTGGASLAGDDAFPIPSQCDDCDVFVVVRDYDYCLNLRCLHLTAVFASFFCFSCDDFETCKTNNENKSIKSF